MSANPADRRIYIDPADVGRALSDLQNSTANALTARAGGGQASATLCTADFNRFTTVASAADSALLPAAVAGRDVVVVNAAATNAMNIFPATGEIINALSANTAISLAAGGKAMRFFCVVNGTWNSMLGA